MTGTRHRRPRAFANPLRWAWPMFAAGLALATPARADDWPTPGLDAAHTRLTTERSGVRFADGRWSFAQTGGAGALASPVVSDGYVVSALFDGTVRALAADSGALAWQVALGSQVEGTPAIAHGRVFVPTLDGNVVALALADGATLWSTALGGLTASSPAVVGSDLIVGAGMPQQFVVRLDGATGAIIWRTLPVMQEFSNTPPAVGGGLVVVGTNGGHYYAFDAATGLARWDYAADGIVNVAAPLIAAGRVYLAGGDQSDRVHAVDAVTGAPIAGWPIELPAPDPDLAGTSISRSRAVSSFAAVGGLIVLETRLDDALDSDGDGLADQALSREWVFALDPTSGAVTWRHAVARVVLASPSDLPPFTVSPTPAAFGTDGGAPLLVVASSIAGTVSILDAATGNDQGDLTVVGRALASPVMTNGRLITVAENGTVEGRLSGVNHPPTAPVLAANPRPLDAADVTLRWAPSMDLDGEQPTYELRLDADGEVLMSYAQQNLPRPGVELGGGDGAARAGDDLHRRDPGARFTRRALPLVRPGDLHRGPGRNGDGRRHPGGQLAERGRGRAAGRHRSTGTWNIPAVGNAFGRGRGLVARRRCGANHHRRDGAVGRRELHRHRPEVSAPASTGQPSPAPPLAWRSRAAPAAWAWATSWSGTARRRGSPWRPAVARRS